MISEDARKIVSLLMRRPITEEIAMEVKSIPGYKHLEITAGEWVLPHEEQNEVTTGEEHGWIETLFLLQLGSHVVANKLGRVYPGDITCVLDGSPGDIRVSREPDVSFVTKENVVPSQGFIYRAPDLAVEIVSPSQTVEEMRQKGKEYFAYGTKQFWLIIPGREEVEVYTSPDSVTVYGVGQKISGGDLIPGFLLDISELFAQD